MHNVLVLGHESYEASFDPAQFDTISVDHVRDNINEVVNLIDRVDLVCFTGGEDIDPEMYGADHVHPATQYNLERDSVENYIWSVARANEKPMIGICRGAQFLCVKEGGKLIQHVHEHGHSHEAISATNPDARVIVTSSHHQMMSPGESMYELLLYSNHDDLDYLKEDEFYDHLPWNPDTGVYRVGPEVILYRERKVLCHQPHPEWADYGSPYYTYFNFTARGLMQL